MNRQEMFFVRGIPRHEDTHGKAERRRLIEVSDEDLLPAATHHVELSVETFRSIGED
jgi:hypothetical protein